MSAIRDNVVHTTTRRRPVRWAWYRLSAYTSIARRVRRYAGAIARAQSSTQSSVAPSVARTAARDSPETRTASRVSLVLTQNTAYGSPRQKTPNGRRPGCP